MTEHKHFGTLHIFLNLSVRGQMDFWKHQRTQKYNENKNDMVQGHNTIQHRSLFHIYRRSSQISY
jgi:adenine specific DNA methylase Mod